MISEARHEKMQITVLLKLGMTRTVSRAAAGQKTTFEYLIAKLPALNFHDYFKNNKPPLVLNIFLKIFGIISSRLIPCSTHDVTFEINTMRPNFIFFFIFFVQKFNFQKYQKITNLNFRAKNLRSEIWFFIKKINFQA